VGLTGTASTGASSRSVPVDPDAQEARQWLLDEMSEADYRAAQPTWFDRLAAAVRDWFESLSFAVPGGPPGIGALVVVLFVVVLLVIAFLIFGLPRLNRRSAVTGSLFGDDDDRASAAMRLAAEAAAARGDYSLAVAEMFRAIARSLAERTVVSTTPGTTAHDFAARAARVFPAQAEGLESAAHDFDDVRYLGGPGSPEQFTAIAALERELRAVRPELEPLGA
jgi:signal transduction histidine kinase